MKKSIILSLLIAAEMFVANTDASAQKGFYAGVQGAPQISLMYNHDDFKDDALNPKSTFGTVFGVTGGYHFNKNMGVAVEGMYSIEGQRYTKNGIDYKQRLDYIKIPVLFTYNTNPSKKVMFTAKAGPQLGILTNSKLNVDTKGRDQQINTKNQYERFTFGATLGAGVRVNVAKNLYVDGGLRLDGAFTNAEDKDAVGYTKGRSKTYNLNAGFEVGVKYFLN